MKNLLLLLAVGLSAALPGTAQVFITSFNQNGQLTWTNVVSNATYRVEWSASPTGAWQSFDALTNLSSIAATSKTVTVQVPTLHRVVWTDAPNPLGDWDYRGYDAVGTLVVTGRLSVVSVTNSFEADLRSLKGNWHFTYVGPPTNDISYLGPLIVPNAPGGMRLSDRSMGLTYEPAEEQAFGFEGTLGETTYVGKWHFYDGLHFSGPFHATRR